MKKLRQRGFGKQAHRNDRRHEKDLQNHDIPPLVQDLYGNRAHVPPVALERLVGLKCDGDPVFILMGRSRRSLQSLAMGRTASLDRRAKRAVGALTLVIAVILAMTIRNSIVALTPEEIIAAPGPQTEDEIVQIGGHTMLLEHGSAANRIAHWLHGASQDSKAFELGNQSFVEHSATLSPEGSRRVAAIADMMTHVKALDAQIYLESTPAEQALEEQRAMQIGRTLIADGVNGARIAVSDDPIRPGKGSMKQPEVVVVLTA